MILNVDVLLNPNILYTAHTNVLYILHLDLKVNSLDLKCLCSIGGSLRDVSEEPVT